MGFFKKLFSGPAAEEREVKIHVEEDLLGKNGSDDPDFLIARLLDFINRYPDKIDGEIMDMLTRKSLSLKNVRLARGDDDAGTDLTYLIEFS